MQQPLKDSLVSDSFRREEYILSKEQQEKEDNYLKIVELLKKAGFKAKYNKFWTWGKDQSPGYITMED